MRFFLTSFLIFSTLIPAKADSIKVAIASNFIQAGRVIAKKFEQEQGHKVILIFGSTGKHYAQIRHGAPYDLFFAADAKRPKLLEAGGYTLKGSRFTYAKGKIVLWSAVSSKRVDQTTLSEKTGRTYIAIANPKLAPYGRAAQQLLQALNVWDLWKGQMIRGENIGQTFQFVKSGNSELGILAYSQILNPQGKASGSYWIVPQKFYEPIEQQAVALVNKKAALSFLTYFKKPEVLKLIQNYGYNTH